MGDWPVMFGSRLSLIEEWLRKRSEFSVFDPMELGLFTAIKEDQELRDMLVHGIAAEYDQERDAIRFHRIDRIKKAKRKPGRPSHRVHRLTVRFSTLREAARRLVAINRSLINLREAVRSL
jgi:hypothetical protein